jgi:NAD(P)H dehydrogenase (quinone)
MGGVSQPCARIAIIGGGPGGYEAALVAAQLGAEVTVVERDGLGGACVLTDCVPSKTLIASSGMMAAIDASPGLGLLIDSERNGAVAVDAARLYARVRALATAQSADVAARLSAEGVKVIPGTARLSLRPARSLVCSRARNPTASGS